MTGPSRIEVLQAEMILGDDARKFLESDVGRVLLGRADAEKKAAIADLCEIDPEDRKAIAALQNKIWRANSIAAWLTELIQGGADAEKLLIAESDDT